MLISWVALVNPSHPYLENDPAPSFDPHHLRISPWFRYRKGKSDPTDAEMAARAVLAGVANATPKSGEGEIEMIRMLKSTRDSASQGTHPGRQPDEGPGRHGSGRTARNTGRSDGHRPRGAVSRASVRVISRIPPRRPNTPFGPWHAVTFNSTRRHAVCRPSWNGSPGWQPRPWSAFSG